MATNRRRPRRGRSAETTSTGARLRYSADSLAKSAAPGRRKAVMLEMRNDVLVDPAWRRDFVAALAPALEVIAAD